jgi:phosphoribosyl 1,2-cyclic phosphodiesterase
MRVWSLSSGSSGNCYLVQEGNTHLLIEAGLGIRRIEFELLRLNVSPALLSAILVSHEHTDHWASALALGRRLKVPVVCTPGTWAAGGGLGSSSCEHVPLSPGQSLRVGCLVVEAFSLPHDAREPVGFVIRSKSASTLMATDMGYAGPDVIALARESDLVILEANHDVDMLMRGPYPAHLKVRILSDRGHLSNVDAGRAIVGMVNGRQHHFWLAHLSRTNNAPRLALSSVGDVLKAEGLSHLSISVALRDRLSLSWDSDGALTQLALF